MAIKKNSKVKETVKKAAKKITKNSKSVKEVKNGKTIKDKKKIKDVKNTKNDKIEKIAKKDISKFDSSFNVYDEEDEEKSRIELPKEFAFKGKEKDLEKELKKDDDIIFGGDDEDDKDPEGPRDEDIIATEEFEESLEDAKSKQFDIFEGVSLDDPVRMYLKEIGQYNLLNIEQEKKLAKEKQDAQTLLRRKKMDEQLPIDTARKIKLNPDELKVIKKGEISQQRLIECNLRLVVSIAKKYIGHGLSLLDLIQEGNLGLIRGIEKFDYKMGFKLSTYVTWWIRQAVSRALADQSKTIRIPVHMVETINRLNKVKKKLTTELGYEPTIKQIAKGMKTTEEKVEEVLQIAMDPISLDKPVGDEDDSIVADFIADQNVISPETNAERVMLKEQIQELLSGLKEREKKVLILRFGIDDDHPRTLEEVGKELNVTRERIRQIEDKALRKLKYRAKNLQQLIK